jgi:hypothetical protein
VFAVEGEIESAILSEIKKKPCHQAGREMSAREQDESATEGCADMLLAACET